MQKILIIDNDYKYLEKLFNDISESLNENLRIVKICNDSEKALEYILNKQIDIIVLELDMPKINGIKILEKILENNINLKVIITSRSKKLIFELINKNLNYYKAFMKPFNMEEFISTLNTLSISSSKDISSDKIIKLLNNFKLNKSTIGYYYILECLNFCIQNNYTFVPQMNDLYKQIELKHNNTISASNIKWAISKTIQLMNKNTDKDILNNFFPYNSYPSPKTFLNEILSAYYNN